MMGVHHQNIDRESFQRIHQDGKIVSTHYGRIGKIIFTRAGTWVRLGRVRIRVELKRVENIST